jgi:peptidyl-prolyl cis-trans isomerase D
MLSFFRQRGISSVLYGIIIVGTILTFVIGFRPNAGSKTAPLSETCVARVRGRCIDPKDFGAAYRSLMPSRSAEASRRLNLKKVALDGLIERELLDDEAKRLGISASDDELTDQLFAGYIRVSVPAADPPTAQTILGEMYQSYARAGLVSQEVAQARFNDRDTAIPVDFRDPKTKAFSMKVYERQVRNISNRSTTEFREGQARELLAAKMRDAIREPIRVSESEAWDTYARQYSTASVTWIPVKESWAARWAVGGETADVADWAKSHADVLAKAVEEHQKDDEPKAGHIRHILVSVPAGATDEEKGTALGKLAWAAARIKNGEPFAEVARDVSDDPGSATKGGDVGDKTDGFVGPFKAAADALKPGETTAGAVETQFGYHLIAKDDPAKASEIAAAVKRSMPRALFAQERGTAAAQQVAKSIADAIRGGKTPEDAVHAAIAPFVRPGAKIEPLKVLPSVEKSDADASAPAAKAAAPQMIRFDAATDSSGPTAHASSAFSRGGDPFPGLSPDGTESVVAFAFAGKAGDVMPAPVRTTDAYVTVVLKEHKESTREDFLKNRDTFAEELERAKRDEAMSLYVKRLREQAKDSIKIDSSYTQEARVDGGASSTDEDEEP